MDFGHKHIQEKKRYSTCFGFSSPPISSASPFPTHKRSLSIRLFQMEQYRAEIYDFSLTCLPLDSYRISAI